MKAELSLVSPLPFANHAMITFKNDPDEEETMPIVPTAVVVAAGVTVGRWWLARNGTVGTAVGPGVLTTALDLTGGSAARAALAVLATASDVLTTDTALSRLDHS